MLPATYDPWKSALHFQRRAAFNRGRAALQRRVSGISASAFRPVHGGKGNPGQKNAGLKAVTLIATLNPVSQVLW